jgi:hypothetical protein
VPGSSAVACVAEDAYTTITAPVWQAGGGIPRHIAESC